MDTNALVSASLIVGSVNDEALNKVLRSGVLAFSEATFLEFTEVLYRPKFDKYLSNERRSQIILKIEQNAKQFIPTEIIRASSDPDDNMFLELAVAAKAACIISGDPHLLVLHPFRSIPILNAADFIHRS